MRHATLEWDAAPPLSDADFADYTTLILPAIAERAQEYLEVAGRALAVVL